MSILVNDGTYGRPHLADGSLEGYLNVWVLVFGTYGVLMGLGCIGMAAFWWQRFDPGAAPAVVGLGIAFLVFGAWILRGVYAQEEKG